LATLPSSTSASENGAKGELWREELLHNTYLVNQEQLREWERQIREVDVPHMINIMRPPVDVSDLPELIVLSPYLSLAHKTVLEITK
jgi:hypothetical protein